MDNTPDCLANQPCETDAVMRRRWVRWLWDAVVVVALAIVILTGLVLGVGYYESRQYPYGRSHCCDKAVYLALLQYADANDGSFPAGEATPEASLSLLYPEYLDANTLRGKTVPLEAVEDLLNHGKRLTPETCGWHYVEGLTTKDNPQIALVWDKIGLDHNGRYLPKGGHYVIFRNGIEYVPGSEWADFIKKQSELLAKRKRPLPSSDQPQQNP